MSSQAGISAWRGVSTASGGMTPEFLLPLEGDLALLVPAVRELALVLVDPLLSARGAARAWRPARST